MSQLDAQLEESTSNVKFLNEKVAQLSMQLQEQDDEIQKLMQERENSEKEKEIFSVQIEDRVRVYKGILDQNQRELDEMREKYETLIEQVPGMDVDSEQGEIKKLNESILERDHLINDFKDKFNVLSRELIDSTEVIEKLIAEKDEYQRLSRNNSDGCCEKLKEMLLRSNERNKELQEMLEMAEDDNMLKAKQTFEAIETLKSYENSQDGLVDALKKIHHLQDTIHQRDKQIKELVVEVNEQNEIVAENSILRKRLGMADEDVIETKGFLAKQKRYAKINNRLMLRLRASEEIRLQLKLDKHSLQRKISQLETQLNGGNEESFSGSENSMNHDEAVATKSKKITTRERDSRIEMKQCENCSNSYNVYESLKFCRNCIMKQQSNFCENCTANLKATSNENIELIKKIAKLEIDYQSIVDLNEYLRVALNEILEKLRACEGIVQINF